MKKTLQKRILAFELVLAMLLPNLTGLMPAVQADTTQSTTYGEATVYDIYDLTGSKTNTIKGTDETWEGQIFADVSEEHKENIVFKTKLTMGQQQVRLALNAKEGTSIYDPPGYAVYINHNGGAPYIAIKRNQADLVVGSVDSVAGTWELEIGIVDILTDGVRTGKHLYVKKDGEVICEVDDTDGYLTGDSLGTKLIDFHYGAAIQMDTTYTYTSAYGTANVYDIYDLTGSKTNTIKGTDETWEGQIFADVSEEHKENIVFKTKLTMGQQQVRLALNAKEGTSIYDPPGYAVYINHNGGAPYIAIKRNQADLVVGSVDSVAGTWELEIGIVDILTDGVRTGKHLYVKKDGEVICEVDDTDGYLTGDSLGTKLIDFHYGAAIQMDTTYTDEYGTANVYDIYDLTGSQTNTVKGTDDGVWDGQLHAGISAEHKENMAFKTKLTMGAQEVRLSLNALEGASVWDPPGYSVYLYGADNRVEIRRNNSTLKDATVQGVAGTYIFEVGIVDILSGGNRVGKHLYIKMNDVVVCEYDDVDGYLTGDSLGTKIIDFHYGAAIQMDSTKEFEPTEPETTEPDTEPETEPQTLAEATVYDIYDLTGFETNTVKGTDDGVWDGQLHASISAEHKENMAFKTKLTMGAQEVRLSLNALEGASVWDPPGYSVYLYGADNRVEIRRNNSTLKDATVQGVAGTYIFEVGIVDILSGGNRVGKHLYIKMNDVVVCEYDDVDGYLTGDSLGTKIIDFHYGAAIQMDSTKEFEPTEPETTEPETTEPGTTGLQTLADATVYDIKDLTGSAENIYYGAQASTLGIPGVDDNWMDSLIGNVNAEDKENVIFKTKLTVDTVRTDGTDTLRLSIGLLDNATALDFQGYSLRVRVDDTDGKTYFGLYRNGENLAYWEEETAIGTYELEFGMQSILEEDRIVGKRLTLKKDGEVLKTYDDKNGYLTGETLGTKVAIFHYVGKVVMESTKPPVPQTLADATVYDIKDLTGSAENIYYGAQASTLGIPGVDDNWMDSLIGNVNAEDKENVIFKTKLTVDTVRTDGTDTLRLSIGLLDNATALDFQGYSLRVRVDDTDGKTYFGLYRNGENLAYWEEETAIGTYELEFGMQSILEEDRIVGKRLTLKKDGEVLKTYDDKNGYLTGETLGTKVAIFHYVGKVVMESTKPSVPQTLADAKVYDIYDLTGIVSNTVKGTDDTWEGQIFADVKPEHKENVAIKTKLTMGAQQVRLSLNAKEGADIYDPQGYAVYLYGDTNVVEIRRNNATLKSATVQGIAGTYILEIGIVDILSDGNRVGKHLYVKIDDVVVCEVGDYNGYLTGDDLGTKFIDFHYGAAIQMDTTYDSGYGEAKVYDLSDLTGQTLTYVDPWVSTKLGNIAEADKEQAAIELKMNITDARHRYRFSVGAPEGADCTDPQGYGLEIAVQLDGASHIRFTRGNGSEIAYFDDVSKLIGEHIIQFGYRNVLLDGGVVGKQVYLSVDGEVLYTCDDGIGYLTGDSLGTMVALHHIDESAAELYSKDYILPEVPEYGILTAADATVYDLYDLMGLEELTLTGRASNPDNWGTTLGYMLEEHKENMAFRTTVTMDEAQTVMLGIGLAELSSAVQLNSGYVLEIVMKTGTDEVDTVKIHRAGTQIYCKDQSLDFNGEYELEFGVVDLYAEDADNKVVGKRIYVKVDGKEVLHYDDTVNALSGDSLGTKVDVYVSGNKLQMTSLRGYQAADATVYDLYDLAFRETLEVDHSDDNGEVIWGVLIGNVEEAHKGNVALKTKVQMSKDHQQNLIIGLGLNGHWPVGSGHGYKIELNGNPDNETDSLMIYKNTDTQGLEPECIYSMQQSFDFNGSFELEVGVVDLLDGNKNVAARRIYVKINGEELMHFDDTRNVVSGEDMGTVVAAYASSGTVTLGTCVDGIPSTGVKIYDIFDLTGRATLQLTRTDAGGEVIWSNEIGQITDTNNMSYALQVRMDTSQVDRSALQELIIGLCKDSDLFDKVGYRLSMYFATDGGTSLVLRDSATDEVLASVNGVIPTVFEMEIGITDFYDSSKAKLGKKIYLKIDGAEVLSYVDKDTNRTRGNLLCAYTTFPVTMKTKYDSITIPVTYVVNGETVETSKYITTNTDVVVGKKSIIDIALGNKDEFTSVILQQVLLNGQPLSPVSDKKGVYVFELEAPSANDQLTVEIEVHTLTVDEAQVYDLYELTGKKEIIIPANSVDQIGTMFADGQEGVLNRAIRFAYYIPATGGGLRLGYGSDTSDIWSRVGTHIELWCGFATISNGFHVSALSSGNTEIFKADSWSIVEVGIVKCYEDGVYKYDRWYVKAGSTLEEMELITYYDSTQRHNSSLNIMARTPDTGDDFILTSTLDVRQVTDISEETAKEEASVAFKSLFLKGETVKIVVFPKEGKTLESLSVNGEQVKTALTSDGGYVFTMENAQEDVEFSYIISDDEHLYNVTADDADNLEFILDKTSVAAGGSVTVQIKVDGGYTLKSLTVNDVDFLPMASYDKTTLTYTLTVSGIREDKHIQAQAEKLSQDGPVADAGLEGNENKTNLPVIIAVAVLAVAVLGGAAVAVVTRARKKGQKQ